MIKRDGSRIFISPIAKARIAQNKCPVCDLDKQFWKRRKDWTCCSTDCTTKYWQEFYSMGWPDLRLKVFKRDNFKCVRCGFIAPTTKKEGYRGTEEELKRLYTVYFDVCKFYYKGKGKNKYLCAEVYDASYLIGDHIIPIALGGSEWEMSNIQTLCKKCNKIKTAQDSTDIAKQRKVEKIQKKNDQLGNYVNFILVPE